MLTADAAVRAAAATAGAQLVTLPQHQRSQGRAHLVHLAPVREAGQVSPPLLQHLALARKAELASRSLLLRHLALMQKAAQASRHLAPARSAVLALPALPQDSCPQEQRPTHWAGLSSLRSEADCHHW